MEKGLIPVTEPVTEFALEAPAGLIRIRAEVRNGKATRITFENVPSFVFALDAPIEVPGLGTVLVDVAYGGMIYVIADAPSLGLTLAPDEARDLVRVGEMIKAATRERLPVRHPQNHEIVGPTIALLSGPSTRPDANLKNTVVVSTGVLDWDRPDSWTGVLDRSPCGTGTCARMATLHARGLLGLGQDFRHEGILGTVLVGRLLRESRVGNYSAVIPTISGQAWITAESKYVLDPGDPFPGGYTVGDIWGAGRKI